MYACPVGAYFKTTGVATTGIDLRVCENFHRAAPKGAGNTKSITNTNTLTLSIATTKNVAVINSDQYILV